MQDEIETILSGYGLVEGPRWAADKGLFFCDSHQGGVFRRDGAGKIETIIPRRKGVGGIALHADGGIVVSGRNICHVKQGVSRVLFELDGAARFNDIATDPSGRLYVGTLRFDPFNPDALPTPGELYRIESEGVATKLYDDVGLTNGIGFSPDGQTIYHSDSLRRHIIAHRMKDDGNCIDRHIFAELPKGAPDGLCVDADGGVWVAAYADGAILRFTPQGELDQKIDLPAKKVTSLCFGEDGLRTLYVTSADNQTDESLGGCIFRLRLGVAGLAHAEVQI